MSDKANPYYLLNNRLLNRHEITISPSSQLFSAGCGFFTTALYLNNCLYFWELHLKRLNSSLSAFNYDLQENLPDRNEAENFLKNQLGNTTARVRLTVFPRNNLEKWDWLLTFQPYRLVLSTFSLKVGEECADYPLLKHKSLNYWQNLKYIQGNDRTVESAMLNRFGNVNEGCRTNILLIKNTMLSYTGFENNYLQGIMQQVILTNYQQLGFTEITAYPQGFSRSDLINADQIILTNSLIGVVGVESLQFNDESRIIQVDQAQLNQLNSFINTTAEILL